MLYIKHLILAAFLAVLVPMGVTACKSGSTVVEAPRVTFEQTLAQAFTTVDAVANLTSAAVVRDRISVEKAEEIEARLTSIVDQLITVKDIGQSEESSTKLEQLQLILLSLEKELTDE